LQINPDLFRVHNNLAILLAGQGEFLESVEHYKQAITQYPGFAKAHNNLGSVLAQQGRFEESIGHERAITIDPNDTGARKNLELARSLAGAKVNAEIGQKLK
jgi:Tfp pilus assembly protein PilF